MTGCSERRVSGTSGPLPVPLPRGIVLIGVPCRLAPSWRERREQWEQPHKHSVFLFPSFGNRVGITGSRRRRQQLEQISCSQLPDLRWERSNPHEYFLFPMFPRVPSVLCRPRENIQKIDIHSAPSHLPGLRECPASSSQGGGAPRGAAQHLHFVPVIRKFLSATQADHVGSCEGGRRAQSLRSSDRKGKAASLVRTPEDTVKQSHKPSSYQRTTFHGEFLSPVSPIFHRWPHALGKWEISVRWRSRELPTPLVMQAAFKLVV